MYVFGPAFLNKTVGYRYIILPMQLTKQQQRMLFSKNCRKFGFLPSLSQIWKSPLADLIKLPCLACAPNCLSFHEGVLYTKKRLNMLWSAGNLKKKDRKIQQKCVRIVNNYQKCQWCQNLACQLIFVFRVYLGLTSITR